MNTLTIIGGGKLGKSLGLVFHRSHSATIHEVLNCSFDHAQAAVRFIGAGRAVQSYEELTPADFVLIATPDEVIAAACGKLAAAGRVIRPGAVVFHCSGSLPARLLLPAKTQGAAIASIHPIKSFADPARAADSFPGTWCGLEGELEAWAKLETMFQACGARVFPINSEQKLIYHAGTVFASNYLTVLVEASLRCLGIAGIPPAQALELLSPMLEGTIRNNVRLGPAHALTGPIARGETDLVLRQQDALATQDADLAAAYQALGRIATDLASAQNPAKRDILAHLKEKLLGER